MSQENSKTFTVDDVIEKAREDDDFRKALLAKLTEDLCWAQRPTDFLREALTRLHPSARPNAVDLQANILLLRLGFHSKAYATEPSYLVIRDHIEGEEKLDLALAQDYADVMSLTQQLYDDQRADPSHLDTIMYRDMNLWCDERINYWEQAALCHPVDNTGEESVRRLLIYDDEWFSDPHLCDENDLKEIRGFLFAVLGHHLLGWGWRAVSGQRLAKKPGSEILFDYKAPAANGIPRDYESSALIGGLTLLYVNKFRRRPDGDEGGGTTGYALSFHRYIGQLGDNNKPVYTDAPCARFKKAFDAVFKKNIAYKHPRQVIERFETAESPDVKQLLKQANAVPDIVREIRRQYGKCPPPVLFISYSRDNEDIANLLKEILESDELNGYEEEIKRPGIRTLRFHRKRLAVWLDKEDIKCGDSIKESIDHGLTVASGVASIISNSYLSRRFIVEDEIPVINRLREQGDTNFHFFPIRVETPPRESWPDWLDADLAFLPEKPLGQMEDSERRRHLRTVAEQIIGKVGRR